MNILSSKHFPTVFDRVLYQSRSLHRQLVAHFSQHHRPPAAMIFEEKILRLFHDILSLSLPPSIEQRAYDEQILVQSIGIMIKMNNLILRRTADQQNRFYLGSNDRFQMKCDDYLKNINNHSSHFSLWKTIDSSELLPELNQWINEMNTIFNRMRDQHHINEEQWKQLRINPSKKRWPYLYFLPHLSNNVKISTLFFISFSLVVFRIRR